MNRRQLSLLRDMLNHGTLSKSSYRNVALELCIAHLCCRNIELILELLLLKYQELLLLLSFELLLLLFILMQMHKFFSLLQQLCFSLLLLKPFKFSFMHFLFFSLLLFLLHLSLLLFGFNLQWLLLQLILSKHCRDKFDNVVSHIAAKFHTESSYYRQNRLLEDLFLFQAATHQVSGLFHTLQYSFL